MSVNFEQVLQTFLVEGRELLEQMEGFLLQLDAEAVDPEAVNAIFRAAHTIKGSAGLFGLEHVVAFTHEVETTLDAVRDGSLALGGELTRVLLACCDHIALLLDDVERHGAGAPPTEQAAGDALIARLRESLQAPSSSATHAPLMSSAAAVPRSIAPHPDQPAASTDQWHISLRFGREVLRNGMDPLSFIRYLGKLGRVTRVETLSDGIPRAEEMDPEACYLGFELTFQSDVDKLTIESAFEFVRDDCVIHILPPKSRISEYLRVIQQLPEEPTRLGEILVRCGTLTPRELELALASQANATPAPPIGEILVARRSLHPEVLDAALSKQRQVKAVKNHESSSIRVDSDKLDHLINLVGELIIAAASTDLVARRARVPELGECTAVLAGLVKEVRDSALQLRMVKIGATLNRFQRVVHDISSELGKDIGLVVSGEETELDKTVVERIGDPLMHLVRNAMDHGIESPEVRRQRGKPARGSVTLNAFHDSGSIVIEVRDDGGGLKREKIRQKAIERGLLDPNRSPSDQELYDLIFEPGFSTAEQVTNLSGRGVGMDVVKRNIVSLRGSVTMSSEDGVGTTVTVRLPLTLAIINGFLVGLGKSTFVVPLDMIEECVEFSAEPGHDYTNLRGRVLPFIRLRELFQVEGPPVARENIVVIKHAGVRAGLVVDALLGEFQTVIKPLSKLFNGVKCISGSSILGTGEVALILDVPSLVQRAAGAVSVEQEQEQPTLAAAS